MEEPESLEDRDITERNRENSDQALADRIRRSDRWMISLTAVVAGGGIISAVIFGQQLSVMSGQLDEMKSSSQQTDKAITASNRIAEATARSAEANAQTAKATANAVIVSNKLVAATTETVAASKRLAEETANAADASRRLVAAAESANITSRMLADSAAKSNEIGRRALLVAQRPFMSPLSVGVSKVTASMYLERIARDNPVLRLALLNSFAGMGDKPLGWDVNVKWENTGNTATRDLTITTYCLFSREAMSEPYNVAKIKDFTEKENDIVFTKNHEQVLATTEQKVFFGPKQTDIGGNCFRSGMDLALSNILPGLLYHQYVFGSATYRDRIDGENLYRTDFCFEITFAGNPYVYWEKGPVPEEVSAKGVRCVRHNCADEECEEQEREARGQSLSKPRESSGKGSTP